MCRLGLVFFLHPAFPNSQPSLVPSLPPLPHPEWITTPCSTPCMGGSNPGEQQVQVKVLIRPGLEPETSQPQRSALPLDHAGLVRVFRPRIGRSPRTRPYLFLLRLSYVPDYGIYYGIIMGFMSPFTFFGAANDEP